MSFGAEIVHVASLGDDARYGAKTVARLTQAAQASGATAIAITGKDLVKAFHPLFIPRHRLKFCAGENAFGELPEKCLLRQHSVADDSDEVRSFSAFWW